MKHSPPGTLPSAALSFARVTKASASGTPAAANSGRARVATSRNSGDGAQTSAAGGPS
jgi:hypothetical protein